MRGSCIRGLAIHEQRNQVLETRLELDGDPSLQFYPDYGLASPGRYRVDSGDEVTIMKMALVGEGDDITSSTIVLGLVLRQVGGLNTERIGLVKFRVEHGYSKAFGQFETVSLRIV